MNIFSGEQYINILPDYAKDFNLFLKNSEDKQIFCLSYQSFSCFEKPLMIVMIKAAR